MTGFTHLKHGWHDHYDFLHLYHCNLTTVVLLPESRSVHCFSFPPFFTTWLNPLHLALLIGFWERPPLLLSNKSALRGVSTASWKISRPPYPQSESCSWMGRSSKSRTISSLIGLGSSRIVFMMQKMFDEFEYDSLLREAVNEGGIKRKVRHFFSSSNPLAFRFNMGNKMKEVRERLDKVAADPNKFNLKKMGLNGPMPVLNRKRENYSYVRASDVIRRDDDKENMIQLLLHPSDEVNIFVLPVVGIGGLGKTTMAKLVYNKGRVVAHCQN